MNKKQDLEKWTVEELEQTLYRKKRAQRQQRLDRLREEGRVVDIAGLAPPDPAPSTIEVVRPNGAATGNQTVAEASDETVEEPPRFNLRWVFNQLLLVIEVGAVLALIGLGVMVFGTARQLNQEIAQVQEVEVASVALPTPSATPVIDVVVLPSGHKPPIDGRPPEPGEAGDIPQHLLPILNAYVPPPIPTPSAEQARRIQIPAIDVDKPIVQGDDWEQLKKGVGQHIGSALPGEDGNLVLSAHNDIYGEIFRHLDKLSPGDEIIVSTERQSYVYVVREIQVVKPTEVWVMASTEHASSTLISCYPYLVNDKRIVVFADLASTVPLGGATS